MKNQLLSMKEKVILGVLNIRIVVLLHLRYQPKFKKKSFNKSLMIIRNEIIQSLCSMENLDVENQ